MFKQGPSAQRSYASSIVDVQELLFSFKSLGHVNLAIQKMSNGSLQAHAPCADEPPTNFNTNLISGRLKPHSLPFLIETKLKILSLFRVSLMLGASHDL